MFVDAIKVKFWFIQGVKINCSKLQNKVTYRKKKYTRSYIQP